MYTKEEVEEWKKIQSRLSGILNRDIKNDLVTKTLMEFIDLYEKQQKYIEKLENHCDDWDFIERHKPKFEEDEK